MIVTARPAIGSLPASSGEGFTPPSPGDFYVPLIGDWFTRPMLLALLSVVLLVGWLLCISFILVASTVVAGELDRAPEAWATRIRYPWTQAQLRPDRTPERSLPATADADLTEAGSTTTDDM